MKDRICKAVLVDSIEQKWLEGYHVRVPSTFNNKDKVMVDYIYTGATEHDKYRVYSNTICEYAGLNDCKGTPIFEDDILLVNFKWERLKTAEVVNECNVRYKVTQSEETFIAVCSDHDLHASDLIQRYNNLNICRMVEPEEVLDKNLVLCLVTATYKGVIGNTHDR